MKAAESDDWIQCNLLYVFSLFRITNCHIHKEQLQYSDDDINVKIFYPLSSNECQNISLHLLWKEIQERKNAKEEIITFTAHQLKF